MVNKNANIKMDEVEKQLTSLTDKSLAFLNGYIKGLLLANDDNDKDGVKEEKDKGECNV